MVGMQGESYSFHVIFYLYSNLPDVMQSFGMGAKLASLSSSQQITVVRAGIASTKGNCGSVESLSSTYSLFK